MEIKPNEFYETLKPIEKAVLKFVGELEKFAQSRNWKLEWGDSGKSKSSREFVNTIYSLRDIEILCPSEKENYTIFSLTRGEYEDREGSTEIRIYNNGNHVVVSADEFRQFDKNMDGLKNAIESIDFPISINGPHNNNVSNKRADMLFKK